MEFATIRAFVCFVSPCLFPSYFPFFIVGIYLSSTISICIAMPCTNGRNGSVALARICFFVFARSPCTVRCEHTAACHSCQSSINYIPRMSPHLYLYDCMNMGECNDRSRITTAGETEKENRESAEKN